MASIKDSEGSSSSLTSYGGVDNEPIGCKLAQAILSPSECETVHDPFKRNSIFRPKFGVKPNRNWSAIIGIGSGEFLEENCPLLQRENIWLISNSIISTSLTAKEIVNTINLNIPDTDIALLFSTIAKDEYNNIRRKPGLKKSKHNDSKDVDKLPRLESKTQKVKSTSNKKEQQLRPGKIEQTTVCPRPSYDDLRDDVQEFKTVCALTLRKMKLCLSDDEKKALIRKMMKKNEKKFAKYYIFSSKKNSDDKKRKGRSLEEERHSKISNIQRRNMKRNSSDEYGEDGNLIPGRRTRLEMDLASSDEIDSDGNIVKSSKLQKPHFSQIQPTVSDVLFALNGHKRTSEVVAMSTEFFLNSIPYLSHDVIIAVMQIWRDAHSGNDEVMILAAKLIDNTHVLQILGTILEETIDPALDYIHRIGKLDVKQKRKIKKHKPYIPHLTNTYDNKIKTDCDNFEENSYFLEEEKSKDINTETLASYFDTDTSSLITSTPLLASIKLRLSVRMSILLKGLFSGAIPGLGDNIRKRVHGILANKPPLPMSLYNWRGWDDPDRNALPACDLDHVPDQIDKIRTCTKRLNIALQRRSSENYKYKSLCQEGGRVEGSKESVKLYLARWNILELFQFMISSVVYNRPESPVNFMHELVKELKAQTEPDISSKKGDSFSYAFNTSFSDGEQKTSLSFQEYQAAEPYWLEAMGL